jgi:hypothetical protein
MVVARLRNEDFPQAFAKQVDVTLLHDAALLSKAAVR